MLMTQIATPALYPNERSASSSAYPTSANLTDSAGQYYTESSLHHSPSRRDTKARTTSASRLQEHPRRGAAVASPSKARNMQTSHRRDSSTMSGFPATTPQAMMYVRALYDYEADDRTSLSFHEGDIIQVITQLESGWWDGVINGVRGWFPSNYCAVIDEEDPLDRRHNGQSDVEEDDLQDEEEYEDRYEDDDGDSDRGGSPQLPMEGTSNDKKRADFWIPQATQDGRLFYFNTMTGESSMELPLESPTSATESGPYDRMKINNIPDRTRPPPEMMARGYMQEDEDTEGDSASEMEGESLMLASSARSSYVCTGFARTSEAVC